MLRELPQPMRFVNAHFTGKPLHTYLWFIWLDGCWSAILYVISLEPGRYSMHAKIYSALGILAFVLLLIRLVTLLTKSDDRAWLLTVYQEQERSAARLDVRIITWLAPILGLIVLCEYWLIQDWQP